MDLTWFGTASVAFRCAQGAILFDPYIPLKGSPTSVTPEEYDGFPDVFVTHCHLDHVAELPRLVKRNPDVRIYCTDTPYKTLRRRGIPERNLILIRYGETLLVNGFAVGVYHGKHAVLPKADRRRILGWIRSPARGNIPRLLAQYFIYRENDETAAFQIEADGKRVFLMGSMNLRNEVEYPIGADVLVLPYNGWNDNFPPAVRIVRRLDPQKILLDHYDETFPPVSPPVDLSPILKEYGERISALEPGKTEHV